MKKESRKIDHPGFSEHSKAACGYSAEMGAFLGIFNSLSCIYLQKDSFTMCPSSNLTNKSAVIFSYREGLKVVMNDDWLSIF